jgi:hypothetical protein
VTLASDARKQVANDGNAVKTTVKPNRRMLSAGAAKTTGRRANATSFSATHRPRIGRRISRAIAQLLKIEIILR